MAEAGAAAGLERLELRIERLKLTFRFTYAFHAREVRFECDEGDGFKRLFPETFSFHKDRHDPAELFLQLDDLLRKSRVISTRANRRDVRLLVTRLLSEAPRYLERVQRRLRDEGRLEGEVGLRVNQDVALLSQVLLRFLETRDLEEGRQLRVAGFLLRKLIFRGLLALVYGRVEPDYLERYMRDEVQPIDPGDDPTESGVFHALESDDTQLVNRMVMRMTERAFYLWVEGVCLDEDNQAFEKEDSPFADRETEVMEAIAAAGCTGFTRGAELSPFLRRPDKDGLRLLRRLETWFLRRYDIPHSSAIIEHAARLERRDLDDSRTLSWHTPRIHALCLSLLGLPFLGAAFFYERAPMAFDLLCSAEVAVVNALAFWFLLYRFCWKRDLTLFHASVPRIFAGVIVGYLPVFLIDEVWDLASRSALSVAVLGTLLGLFTLLYVYIEVQRKLGDRGLAFARARGLFLLGTLEASAMGIVMTSLVGRYMVSRNWSDSMVEVPVETLRLGLEPLVGQLPRVIGTEPFLVFPSAVLLMTFLSFFIGIFLQLMWEDLPITEPL